MVLAKFETCIFADTSGEIGCLGGPKFCGFHVARKYLYGVPETVRVTEIQREEVR